MNEGVCIQQGYPICIDVYLINCIYLRQDTNKALSLFRKLLVSASPTLPAQAKQGPLVVCPSLNIMFLLCVPYILDNHAPPVVMSSTLVDCWSTLSGITVSRTLSCSSFCHGIRTGKLEKHGQVHHSFEDLLQFLLLSCVQDRWSIGAPGHVHHSQQDLLLLLLAGLRVPQTDVVHYVFLLLSKTILDFLFVLLQVMMGTSRRLGEEEREDEEQKYMFHDGKRQGYIPYGR